MSRFALRGRMPLYGFIFMADQGTLVMKYNRELEKSYTVVIWEQHGAGKSYYQFQEAYDFACRHAGKKEWKRLQKIDCTYTADSWLKDLLFVTGQVVKHKGSLYGQTNYQKLITPFLGSKYYTISDLIQRQKGSLQAIQYLWQELMQVNFEGQTRYQVPIILIEGRHDSHVSSTLAKQYFDTIETKKKFYWFEESCHFPQWSENKRFHKVMDQLQQFI